jgi:hypothetical protein
MSYRAIKWIILWTLFLTVPSMLFMVQVVIFLPAIFFVGGLFITLSKILVSSISETIAFSVFLVVHLLVYFAVYYVISVIAAKIIIRISNATIRNVTVFILVICLGMLTLLPVYGGGGHGPIRWGSLISAVGNSYGIKELIIIYLI